MNERQLLRLAYRAALHSPDSSTQNGAFLTDRAKGPVFETVSCNEFPHGVAYSEERWLRPLKYALIVHAERQAIYKAAALGIKTRGLVLVAAWAACAECAQAVVQSGIEEVIRHTPPDDGAVARWRAQCETGDMILREGGVRITEFRGPMEDRDLRPILRDGKEFQP